ncbi:MAG: Rrf2 family transcriptional regulator [Acidobacteriota bacterium]
MNSDLTVALHILGFLTACAPNGAVTSETLARSYGTNPVVIRRTVSKLRKAGLVETQRGSGGGTSLARDPSTINLRQVYEAVAERSALLRRHPGTEGGVANILGSYINGIYDDAEEALFRRLEEVSIEEMDANVRPQVIDFVARARQRDA